MIHALDFVFISSHAFKNLSDSTTKENAYVRIELWIKSVPTCLVDPISVFPDVHEDRGAFNVCAWCCREGSNADDDVSEEFERGLMDQRPAFITRADADRGFSSCTDLVWTELRLDVVSLVAMRGIERIHKRAVQEVGESAADGRTPKTQKQDIVAIVCVVDS